ncbi:ADP-ribosylglycohydrolase family protein [Streptomyces acidiscabies]|uniref:ADP-ribosylglycohydrolase family protein n=2 Tax=Streptomyces acidiscabies TaxID=42234 RepID=A0AAP6BH08_9ACTN|nr:ADP-ribosylglycohydrolase family protein [Streptomyces acidiscabies]MBP5940541.1 ADP-ribosylglycohydrolase family protein [Streptomyces sp. LBUM 1476]MBZ3911786.1 ADP-ribosylglycohydrolase family protein [Streptomyces acidiscabies]MDX2964588.1 ADP-ribosylglycohydrolase family protein [Streptomyces acidiscabies]MDX3024500.1 ADP-ribosylglycohydrolase family protein [Streptomyces acidiscabies]MDX3794862.1 ADP-ribosylglycohydrolase family protein [Streptomyces acidiscabies]
MSYIAHKRAASGALVGLALGDAFGFPTEFNDVPQIVAKFGPWRQMPLPTRAFVSDDTQMTLALARGLRSARDRGVLAPLGLERSVREEFVKWYHSPENNRAPGTTCLRACELLDDPERHWQDASRIDSKGCGANMRVAPIGLAPALSDEQRAGAAQLQAGLTHGHPTALAASDLTAHAVRLLAHGTRPDALIGLLRAYALANRSKYRRDWLGDLWTRSQDPSPEHFIARGWDECLAVLDRLEAALLAPDPEADPCLATGAGWIAEEALATGLFCFLLFPEEPVTALRRAACSSGDSDSIACLTGAFAGAWLGIDAWPTEWADRIEYGSELVTLGALWDE